MSSAKGGRPLMLTCSNAQVWMIEPAVVVQKIVIGERHRVTFEESISRCSFPQTLAGCFRATWVLLRAYGCRKRGCQRCMYSSVVRILEFVCCKAGEGV